MTRRPRHGHRKDADGKWSEQSSPVSNERTIAPTLEPVPERFESARATARNNRDPWPLRLVEWVVSLVPSWFPSWGTVAIVFVLSLVLVPCAGC